jgi:glycosyltransferase involved in cell wall biosynthesis
MKNGTLCVMQVVSNLGIGGAQEVVRTLAENMERVGCRSVVCAFQDGPLRAEIERLGIPVEILPAREHGVMNFPFFLMDMWKTRRALIGLVKKHGVDVIQTHLLRSLDFLVLSLRLQTDVRVFWTFHNARFELREEHLAGQKWTLQPKLWGYRFFYGIGARGTAGLVAVSEQVREAMLQNLRGVPAGRIVTICNSVDVTRYGNAARRAKLRADLRLGADDVVAAMVATFKEQKGHRFLLEALPDVVEQFPQFHILMIGDGALRSSMETLARDLHLEKCVHFLGNRSDVPDLLAASDLFLLPSLWEGLPMALVEAMASGLPSIATQVSGTSQVMLHSETGLLVPPASAEKLRAALVELLASPKIMKRMGNSARQRVEIHFGAQKQAREYLALFTGELQTKPRNRHSDETAWTGENV